MTRRESGPQGPNIYFGRLDWSIQVPGALALFGPTLDVAGGMAYGEVYRWLEPGSKSPTIPKVDREWLEQQIGKNMTVYFQTVETSSVKPQHTTIFRVEESPEDIRQIRF